MFAHTECSVYPAASMTVEQFNRLIERHGGRLASFVRRRIGNPHDVEDLVQDTLLEAFRCMSQFRGQSLAGTWLFGIALNVLRNHYKRAKLRHVCHDVDIEVMASDSANDPWLIAQYRERLQRVAAALENLPHDSRLLLLLIVEDDLSYSQAAQRLAIPIGTVRSRVSRVRSFLQRSADSRQALSVPAGECPRSLCGRHRPSAFAEAA